MSKNRSIAPPHWLLRFRSNSRLSKNVRASTSQPYELSQLCYFLNFISYRIQPWESVALTTRHYLQKWALTSPTSGCRSIVIVHSCTKAAELLVRRSMISSVSVST
jgi:hypothetical protein